MLLVRLAFKSKIHLGADQRGIGREKVQDTAHADTLFSMLVNAAAELSRGDAAEVDGVIQGITALSSGFIYHEVNPGQFTYYLPRPLSDPANFTAPYGLKRKLEYLKLLKECRLVTLTTFGQWVKGETIDLDEIEKAPYQNLGAISLRPQHARDRLTETAAIFHVGELYFVQGAGLYFLIEGLEEKLLEALLQRAAENGLGGRRKPGAGTFTFEIEPRPAAWEQLFKRPGSRYITLSLFYPEKGELDTVQPLAYTLVPRQGWTYSAMAMGQYKRQSCYMFGEGSIFMGKPMGTLLDVADKTIFQAHPVYRYGKALAVPITLPGGGF